MTKEQYCELVSLNKAFVVKVAEKFEIFKNDENIFEREDLIRAGTRGLLVAAQRFDPSKKTQFLTYAYFWVFQAIRSDLKEHNTVIRHPHHYTLEQKARTDPLEVNPKKDEPLNLLDRETFKKYKGQEVIECRADQLGQIADLLIFCADEMSVMDLDIVLRYHGVLLPTFNKNIAPLRASYKVSFKDELTVRKLRRALRNDLKYHTL